MLNFLKKSLFKAEKKTIWLLVAINTPLASAMLCIKVLSVQR